MDQPISIANKDYTILDIDSTKDPRLCNFCCYMDLLQLKTELTFLSQSRSGASPVVLLELRLPAYDHTLSKSAARHFSVFSSSTSF